ncbi:hypothetical protein QSH39_014635 [Xanthomonas arboricola pv. corylina]|uniref:hypothetical protein n=1 Tax=Xanthomonas arboricola TaxID=56448 RepID=UPI0025B09B76|nr:hypothetical protein [Xanthomonas arboricola]MDN0202771.1 hypothetical protein [Xanthomonas arboricola pv. corylina]MDN0215324.1 hypothetical protein [Xanthomonas arboricola pv. corylina]
MHALLITAAAALIGVAIPAAAGEPSQFGRTSQLYQETSASGETLDAFIVRIAPRARAASVSTRAIVCGEILGSGPYTLALKTDGYPDDCRVPKTAAPYVLVNGIAKDARADHLSIANRFRPGYLVTPWSIKFQDRSSVRKVDAGGH